MSGLIECHQKLLALTREKGYLTFDDILNVASASFLSLSEIDRLSDNLQSLGVLLYEKEPGQPISESDALSDYSRTDYDTIFSEIVELSESTAPFIEFVKTITPPQFGEIQHLVEQLQYENEYARERLVLSHLRVALKISLSLAKQYSYDIEDALSSSLIGLMEAVERFNPNGFSAFQAYASMWIQQNVHRYCNPRWLEYYCPMYVREKLFPVLLHYNSNNRTIIEHDEFDDDRVLKVADELEISPEEVRKYLRFAYCQQHGRISIEDELFDETLSSADSLKQSVLLTLAADNNDPHDLAAENQLRQIVSAILDDFKLREQEVIRLRFGLGGGVPKTLEDVGQMFCITRERVRQIETKCIRRLRNTSSAKKLVDYYY